MYSTISVFASEWNPATMLLPNPIERTMSPKHGPIQRSISQPGKSKPVVIGIGSRIWPSLMRHLPRRG